MQNVDDLRNSGLVGREARLKLVGDIANSEDISAAAVALKAHLEAFDAHLLSIKFCDSAEPGKAIRPYSAYPKDLMIVGQQLVEQGGCPFAKEAMRRLSAFDSCNIDRNRYASFLDRRFFKELEKAGHHHIAVVPVMLGRAVALFTVGLYDQPFRGHMREQIVEAIGQCVPAFIDRFQGVKTMFEKKYLSGLERQVLQLLCEGAQPHEVEEATGLSEFTVALLIQNASGKLQASGTQNLIYKALALGEIDPSPAMKGAEQYSRFH